MNFWTPIWKIGPISSTEKKSWPNWLANYYHELFTKKIYGGAFHTKILGKIFFFEKKIFLTKNYLGIFFPQTLQLIFCPPCVLRDDSFFKVLKILNFAIKKVRFFFSVPQKWPHFVLFIPKMTNFSTLKDGFIDH